MDIILDANAYIQVLYNHGRTFFQTNQFAELLTYLRRTGSRLVIPEVTYNEVVARYRDRLTEVASAARSAWTKLQRVGMQKRIDFLEPDVKSELSALYELLHRPGHGVESLIYTDYSGVDVKEVTRRGIERVRPANDAGEELRDVILWMIVLQYAKQSKSSVAFVSGDKTFQHTDGSLHPSLRKDVDGAGVGVLFYPLVGDFVKANALASEPFSQGALEAYVGAGELRGIAREQLVGSSLRSGTIVGAEVSRCELAEAQRYRVAGDSYYVEARYTGDATIRVARTTGLTFFTKASTSPQFITDVMAGPLPNQTALIQAASEVPHYLYNYNQILSPASELVPEFVESSYNCTFSIRLSLRIAGGNRESLEVDELALISELTPTTVKGPRD